MKGPRIGELRARVSKADLGSYVVTIEEFGRDFGDGLYLREWAAISTHSYFFCSKGYVERRAQRMLQEIVANRKSKTVYITEEEALS